MYFYLSTHYLFAWCTVDDSVVGTSDLIVISVDCLPVECSNLSSSPWLP